MSESTHDDELTTFEAALARMTPMPEGINIARLLFQAGRLSAPRRSWAWPCATAASMMLAATLGLVLVVRPTPQPAERIVTVFVPSPTPPAHQPELSLPSTGETPVPVPQPSLATDTEQPPSEGDYLQIRRAILAKGLDALPPPKPWPAAMPAEDTDTLLDMPHDSRDPWFLRLKRSLKSGDAS
jgi:hypothetical protein